MDAITRPGLRERKKSKTRATIVEVALRHFLRDGFDAVTLERVADECEVSVRTILRYFNTKEALALAPEHDGLQRFREMLPKRTTNAMAFWRSFVAAGLEQGDQRTSAEAKAFRRRLDMIFSDPRLFAQLLTITYEYEDLLAAAIIEETGAVDPLGGRLLATLLVAGNSASVRHWIASGEDIDTTVLLESVDYAASAFRPTRHAEVWRAYARRGRAATEDAAAS